jgi:hypothetical protein
MALGVGGTVVARARAILDVDTRGYDRGVDQAERRINKWHATARKAALGVGIGFAVGATKAIDAASDLNEEINKSSVVFGKSSASVLDWSKKSATAFGVSRRAALQYAGVFGNMLRPMGFTERAAAGMSKRLVGLAADMASFNNAANPEDVLLALRAGLAGETEPLRKFGVFLSQARIQAEALADGIAKRGQTLTAAQKTQATYNVILKDTVLQQGDFARTAGTVANRQRSIAAQTENLQAQLGQGLLPAYAAVLGVSLKLVDAMTRHATATKVALGVVGGLAAGILGLNAALKVARSTMVAFNLVMAANPLVLVAAAVAALGIALVVAYKKSETFRRVVNGVFLAVRNVVAAEVGAIVKYLDLWLGGMSALANAASHLPLVGGKFKGVGDEIDKAREKLNGLDDAIRGKKHRNIDVVLNQKTQTVMTERFDRPSSTAVTSAGARHAKGRSGRKPRPQASSGAVPPTTVPDRTTTATAATAPTAAKPIPVVVERDKTVKEKAKATADAHVAANRRTSRGGGRVSPLGLTVAALHGAGARRNYRAGSKVSTAGLDGTTARQPASEALAQALAARAFQALGDRQSFISTFGPNTFTQKRNPDGTVERTPGTTLVVENHQHFNAPTPDKHREARYARAAMRAAFDT